VHRLGGRGGDGGKPEVSVQPEMRNDDPGKSGHLCSGVDVMIAIIGDFAQFSLKKWPFS
jgi:hypothetical protein